MLPEDEADEYTDSSGTEEKFRFKVRYIAAAADGADQAADALYVKGTKAILDDPTLGGAVRFVRKLGRKWEMERAEVQQMAVVTTFEAEFSTDRRDPSVRGL